MARRLAGRDDDRRDLLSERGVLVSKATGRAAARGDRAADPLLRAPAPTRGGSAARCRVRRRADPHAAGRVAEPRGRERGGGEHASGVDGALEQAPLHVRLRALLSPRLRDADRTPCPPSLRGDPGEHDAGLPRVLDRASEALRQPGRRLHARAEPGARREPVRARPRQPGARARRAVGPPLRRSLDRGHRPAEGALRRARREARGDHGRPQRRGSRVPARRLGAVRGRRGRERLHGRLSRLDRGSLRAGHDRRGGAASQAGAAGSPRRDRRAREGHGRARGPDRGGGRRRRRLLRRAGSATTGSASSCTRQTPGSWRRRRRPIRIWSPRTRWSTTGSSGYP